MILFDLRCQDGHRFEAWFRDGATYDSQAEEGIVLCPVCGSSKVDKAPMAPRILKGRGNGPAAEDGAGEDSAETTPTPPVPLRGEQSVAMGQIREKLQALRRYVETHSDDVGDRFAEEARRIHYGETPRRDIHGRASDSEAEELADEGVAFTAIPWVPRTDS